MGAGEFLIIAVVASNFLCGVCLYLLFRAQEALEKMAEGNTHLIRVMELFNGRLKELEKKEGNDEKRMGG